MTTLSTSARMRVQLPTMVLMFRNGRRQWNGTT